uniref:UDP-N-acetylmuramate--L-alanine ligase n=1 Tax=candidate division WOR-3 bacterium TaxID=2052148 RepID=A0A7C4THI3_UNCW3
MKNFLGKTERIHFVVIGGIGMSGLALVFHNLRFKVTGSDINPSPITKQLKKARIKVSFTHKPENVLGADVVVYSTAIRDDNPEISEAKRLGIPVIHRSELLAELTRMKNSICISGTHGKTTTTSLVSEVLQKGKLSPTTVIGGIVKGKSQGKLGQGQYLVCEADESDKSFLRLHPIYTVITNIEPEHLEYYRDIEEIKENFIYFANHVPFWGCVFLGSDSPANLEIRKDLTRKVILYGLNEEAILKAQDIEYTNFGSIFKVFYSKNYVGRFEIKIPGRHNVINSLAAIGVGIELGISVKDIMRALKEFRGVKRRIEHCGSINGIEVFDDYGHHPTEIAITLQTLKEYFPTKRIIAIFQPHRYTRTYHLFDQFARSFIYASILIVTEIYPAHEIPIPGITGEALARRIEKEQEPVYFIKEFDKIVKLIKKIAQPGDVIIVQGAGNINRIIPKLLRGLKEI